jgi:hypothetical protein
VTRTVKVFDIPACIRAKMGWRKLTDIADEIGITTQSLYNVLKVDTPPPKLLAWLGLREIEGMHGVYEEIS